MRLPPALFALLIAAPAAIISAAPRVLESFACFSPASFELTVTREQESAPTAKGVANSVAATRLTNRDLLAPVIAEYGGKSSDWSLVAYADSTTFENVSDLTLLALNSRTKQRASVAALRLDTLLYHEARSSAYTLIRSADTELRSATFDQKYLVTCDQSVAGGTLVASGSLAHTLSFGPLKASGQTLRVFKPGPLRLVLTGTHTTEAAGTGVAELVLTLAAPRFVPVYEEETIDIGDGLGGSGVSTGPN